MIYVICGPTGSGKTSAANKLSDYLNAPIINADAFQVYKEMNIGTAKINSDDSHYGKYSLLDIKLPSENFSVMEYQKFFRKTLNELQEKYKDVIVCGGTGLYIRASLYDYVFEETEKDDTSDLEEMDNDQLYNLLLKLDPESANNIHKNNRKRVIRAISIARSGKELKSENIAHQSHTMIYPDVRMLMVSPKREELYENINQRVETMFLNGLIEEVKYLLGKYEFSTTAKAAIGYKEVIEYLDNKLPYDECKELIKQRTRNYAKRQVTFFKHQFECAVFENGEELVKAVMQYE